MPSRANSADLRVRLRPTGRTVLQIAGRVLLCGVSAAFIVGGLAHPASVGGVLFLLLGAVGVVLFAGGALTMIGNLAAGRPVLEISAEGVRRPAGWPRRGGRVLPWDDLAAVCAWSQGIPSGRGHQHHLTFLPRGEADRPAPGAEILAIKVRGLPGVADPRWSLSVTPAWDASIDDVVAAVRRHRDVPCRDRRDRPAPGRRAKPRTKAH